MSASVDSGETDPKGYLPDAEALRAIGKRHGLGEVRAWRRLPGGVVNPVLLLDERVVLRINVRDVAVPKVPKEAWALRHVERTLPLEASWRVPHVVAADTNREILPYDYLLLERLPGISGSDAWETWTAAAVRTDLSRQLGHIFAELHVLGVPGERYGGWNTVSETLGASEDWRTLVEQRNEAALTEVERLGALDKARVGRVRRWLTAQMEVVPRRPARSLAHRDFALWNTLVQPNGAEQSVRNVRPDGSEAPRITGVLDFEWCEVAPPAWDFAVTANVPAEELDADAFLVGYLARSGQRSFDEAFVRQVQCYEVNYHLGMLAVSAQHWGGRGAASRVERIEAVLRGELGSLMAAAQRLAV